MLQSHEFKPLRDEQKKIIDNLTDFNQRLKANFDENKREATLNDKQKNELLSVGERLKELRAEVIDLTKKPEYAGLNIEKIKPRKYPDKQPVIEIAPSQQSVNPIFFYMTPRMYQALNEHKIEGKVASNVKSIKIEICPKAEPEKTKAITLENDSSAHTQQLAVSRTGDKETFVCTIDRDGKFTIEDRTKGDFTVRISCTDKDGNGWECGKFTNLYILGGIEMSAEDIRRNTTELPEIHYSTNAQRREAGLEVKNEGEDEIDNSIAVDSDGNVHIGGTLGISAKTMAENWGNVKGPGEASGTLNMFEDEFRNNLKSEKPKGMSLFGGFFLGANNDSASCTKHSNDHMTVIVQDNKDVKFDVENNKTGEKVSVIPTTKTASELEEYGITAKSQSANNKSYQIYDVRAKEGFTVTFPKSKNTQSVSLGKSKQAETKEVIQPIGYDIIDQTVECLERYTKVDKVFLEKFKKTAYDQ